MEFGAGGHHYPPAVDISTITGKISYFMGDRWIAIGKVNFMFNTNGTIRMVLPDINLLLSQQIAKEDGSAEWLTWGPRLN